VAAIATAVGVGVALFGASFWRWWRRPRLSVDYEYSEERPSGEIRICVKNSPLRDTARDVEVFVIDHEPARDSIAPGPGPLAAVQYNIMRPLAWVAVQEAQADIPAGFRRPASFFRYQPYGEDGDDSLVTLSTLPDPVEYPYLRSWSNEPRQETPGHFYIAVLAANARARYYRVRVRYYIAMRHMYGHTGERIFLHFHRQRWKPHCPARRVHETQESFYQDREADRLSASS
jgi:hypothetical protein